MKRPVDLTRADARRIWLRATRLDEREPFGSGPDATRRAVEHLGYVQIDTINVIERAHHHILYARIAAYRRDDLGVAQSTDKSVFEYWTHALAYVPTRDLRHFLSAMAQHRTAPSQWFARSTPEDLRRLRAQLKTEGPLSIRDVDGDTRVEKDHPWASRKPSKRVLELGFFNGEFVVGRRDGMVKTYDLIERHFGWPPRPKPATPGQTADYLLDRAITAQGIVNAASVMYPRLRFSEEIAARVESRVRRKGLVPVTVEGEGPYWVAPEMLEARPPDGEPLVHVLSPFDPLIIQRQRLARFFGYDHVFEAYVKKENRRFGYFTLPVLLGDEVVAALDIKADRAAGRLLIQAWHWVGTGGEHHRPAIEAELQRFERFQLG